MMVESGELAEVEAGDGLDPVVLRGDALVGEDGDEVEVLLLVEVDAVLLPELLGVAGAPSELAPVDLVLELVDGAEDALVLLEELAEVLEHLVDVGVDPVAVLQLEDEVEGVDVREVLLAAADILEIVDEHQRDPGDLLPAEVVQDLRHLLNDGQGVVLEELVRELVVAQDPEQGDHVVADLWALETGPLQQVRYDFEAVLRAELSCQVVGLEQDHQGEGVGVHRQLQTVDVLLHEPVQELSRLLVALLVLLSLDENGEHVRGHVPLPVVLRVVLVDEAIEDADQVLWVLEVVHDADEMVHSCPRVLQDAVEMRQGVGDQEIVTPDLLDHLEEAPDRGLGLLLVGGLVEEMPLLLVVGVEELLEDGGGALRDKSFLLVEVQLAGNLADLEALAEGSAGAGLILAVGEVAAVHEDAVMMLGVLDGGLAGPDVSHALGEGGGLAVAHRRPVVDGGGNAGDPVGLRHFIFE
mmetsp:Transcript_16549/g.28133  ORF Transcript_16549/g.28133 Transcript_16549/m.28133 type:complete len:468 (+) Transcript_16549:1408-2811(+)